jgi:hypothetical protein
VVQETAARRNEGVLGNLIVRIGKRLIPASLKGSLQLTLPSGKQVLIGIPGEGFAADLTLRNFKVVWASVRRAQLGFFESYLAGDIESTDPRSFSSSISATVRLSTGLRPVFFSPAGLTSYGTRGATTIMRGQRKIFPPTMI